MELRQLDYLAAVVDEAGFTRAAAKLHVAQPGISAQIRQLERELGQQLLDRSGRVVRPTQVGAAVLVHAREALAAVDRIRQTADEFAGLMRGHLTIGTASASHTGDLDLPALLANFRAAHPDVDITLAESNSADLFDGLRANRFDAAFVPTSTGTPDGIECADVRNERLVAAVAPGHPLSGRKRIALTDLRDESLICLPRGSGLRGILETACADAGFEPQVAFEAGSPPVLARFAAAGLGVAVLPESAVTEDPSVHMLSISPQVRGRIVFAWRSSGPLSAAAAEFVRRCRSEISRTLEKNLDG